MPLDRKAAVLRWFDELFNRGRLEAIDELFAPGAVIYESGIKRAPKMLRAVYTSSVEGIPDMRIEVDELIAEDSRIMARWTLRGTHTGDYMGIPASGRAVSMIGVSIFHFDGDRVAECWDVEDTFAMLRQMGAFAQKEGR